MFASHPFFQHLIERYGAGFVGVIMALESLGLPLPAESALIATSVYAGTTHHLNIYVIVIASSVGAIVGDNIGYLIGRSIGWRVLGRYGHYVGLNEDRLTLGRYLFQRHGMKVVFFGRFVVFLRTVAAVLAGASHMQWGKFMIANALGGIAWSCAFGFGGYFMGSAVNAITGPLGIGLAIVAVIAIGAGIWFVKRRETELLENARAHMK